MLHRHSRLTAAGTIHFLTTVASERGRWFIDESVCFPLLESCEFCRSKFDLICWGYVLMPDHLHILLFQETEGKQASGFMESFKRFTSKTCKPVNFNDRTLWHKFYDDVPVPGSDGVKTKLSYMHQNPVRAGLVVNESDYHWSSAAWYAGGCRGTSIIHLETP